MNSKFDAILQRVLWSYGPKLFPRIYGEKRKKKEKKNGIILGRKKNSFMRFMRTEYARHGSARWWRGAGQASKNAVMLDHPPFD